MPNIQTLLPGLFKPCLELYIVVNFIPNLKDKMKPDYSVSSPVDDGKARGKRLNSPPVLNLPLCYWSSQLFDLRAPSSTDVHVLLLNQPIC